MSNINKALVVALILVVGIVGFLLMKPQAPANLGALVGPDVYSYLNVHGNLSTDGTFTSTGSITGSGTITASGAITGLIPTANLATTTALSVSSPNKTYFITGDGTMTLPTTASSSGIRVRFVIASAISADAIISSAGGASGDDIEGSLIVAGAVVDCNAADILTFVSDGEDLGDYVELTSNGSKWFITGSNALTASKLTCSG